MKKLGLFAAILFAASSTAFAQSAQIVFQNGGSIDDGHYYVGNYNATLAGTPTIVNCVDFFHEVSNGDVWTVNETSLGGDLANTRLGDAGRTSYQEAAFLTTLYASAGNTDVINIQHAVWSLFGGVSDPNVVNAASSSWITYAATNYMTAGLDYNNFTVLTDARVRDGVTADGLTKQEFLTTTPEPSTYALLGTGLIGLAPLARRRKRQLR